MVHQGLRACHWCEESWKENRAYRRHCFGGHHRWLDQDNPLRKDSEEAPPARTKASIARDARASYDSALPWKHRNHPRRGTGVNSICALSLYPLFDIVWDVMPDWMHIIKNLVLPHFIKVVKGKRRLKPPRYKKVPVQGDGATREQIEAVIR